MTADWRVWYVVHETSEELDMLIFDAETIEDALKDARFSLNALQQGWYTIIRVELEPNA